MESFYIGAPGERLYCNLHFPRTRLVRDMGVLLCPPIGHEYYRTYRALVRLAEQLSDSGYTVMRFDYLGTGESEGPSGHARIQGWASDAGRAAARLQEVDTVNQVAMIGMRAGAVNAALAALELDLVKLLVMWEPTIPGDTYVAGLSQLHQQLLTDLERFPFQRDSRDSLISEYVGYVYGQPLLDDFRALDPAALIPDATQTIILCSTETESECEKALLESGKQVKQECLQHGGYGWREVRRVSETVVDPFANRKLAALLDEAAA